MKKFFIRIISLVLLVAMMLNFGALTAFAADDEYVCSDYAECTADGAEIYIITKDNCPIRKEPHNKGEVVARGRRGALLSVNKVFWTIKGTRWCELNVQNSDEKLYIHIDNCKPHSYHTYVNVLTTDNSCIDFCPICGIGRVEAEGKSATCDLTCILDHAAKGSYSKADNTFMSILSEIFVSEVMGPIADVRDLFGDVATGQPGWVIAMDCVAFVPLVGALKYSDELATVGKHADDLADLGKHIDDIPWGKWEDYGKAVIGEREYAKLGDFFYTRHAVDEFLNGSIETNLIRGVEHSRGVPPSYVNWILTEGADLNLTKISAPYVDEVTGAIRRKFTNGSLSVVVEEGNIVVSIFSK